MKLLRASNACSEVMKSFCSVFGLVLLVISDAAHIETELGLPSAKDNHWLAKWTLHQIGVISNDILPSPTKFIKLLGTKAARSFTSNPHITAIPNLLMHEFGALLEFSPSLQAIVPFLIGELIRFHLNVWPSLKKYIIDALGILLFPLLGVFTLTVFTLTSKIYVGRFTIKNIIFPLLRQLFKLMKNEEPLNGQIALQALTTVMGKIPHNQAILFERVNTAVMNAYREVQKAILAVEKLVCELPGMV